MKGGYINLHPIYNISKEPILHPDYKSYKNEYTIISNNIPIDYNTFLILSHNKEIIRYKIGLILTHTDNSTIVKESIDRFINDTQPGRKVNFIFEVFNLYNILDESDKKKIKYILDYILDIKKLNNYYAPVLITQTFGIFNDFGITNYIICRKTNDIYYELFSTSGEGTSRIFELHSNFTYHEIDPSTPLIKLPLKSQMYDYLKIQDPTYTPENTNYMLNYLTGLLSSKIEFNIDNMIKVLNVEIVKQQYNSLKVFLEEFITFGNDNMIIYKTSLNIQNMYILMGKPIYFIKIFDLFKRLATNTYTDPPMKSKDEIVNAKSFNNLSEFGESFKKKSYTYNGNVISKNLIVAFVRELKTIISLDEEYILNYYNYSIIYDQQNITFNALNKENALSFRSYDDKLKRLNKLYKLDRDGLNLNFMIDHLLLFLKYSNAYNIPANNPVERKQYGYAINTIINHFLYYQIDNLPFLSNKDEIMANLYEKSDPLLYKITQGSSLLTQHSVLIDNAKVFYRLIKSDFIIIKQDYMTHGSQIKMMCGEATILNIFNYFLYNKATKKIDVTKFKNNSNAALTQFFTENNTFELIEQNKETFYKLLQNIPSLPDNGRLYLSSVDGYDWEIGPTYSNICYIINYLTNSNERKNISGMMPGLRKNFLKNLIYNIFHIDPSEPDQKYTYNSINEVVQVDINKITLKLASSHSNFEYGVNNSEVKNIYNFFHYLDPTSQPNKPTYIRPYNHVNKYLKLWYMYGIYEDNDKSLPIVETDKHILKLCTKRNITLDSGIIGTSCYDKNDFFYNLKPYTQNTNFIYWYYIYILYNSFNEYNSKASFFYLLANYNLSIPDGSDTINTYKLSYNNHDDIINTFIIYMYTVKDFPLTKLDLSKIKSAYTELIKGYINDAITYIRSTYTINEDMVFYNDLHAWPSCQSSLKDILINNLPENPEDPLPVALKLPKVYTEILRYKYIRLIEFDEEIINDIYLTYDIYQKGGSYDKYIKYKTKLSLLTKDS